MQFHVSIQERFVTPKINSFSFPSFLLLSEQRRNILVKCENNNKINLSDVMGT